MRRFAFCPDLPVMLARAVRAAGLPGNVLICRSRSSRGASVDFRSIIGPTGRADRRKLAKLGLSMTPCASIPRAVPHTMFADKDVSLRPDEGSRLEFRDVEIVDDRATGETILEISVRGKRGVGYCKSMPGAVLPFERLRDRLRPTPLPDGRSPVQRIGSSRPRTANFSMPFSMRRVSRKIEKVYPAQPTATDTPTSACGLWRVPTSIRSPKTVAPAVEMIEKFYAAHIKNMIDAAAVNVRRTVTPTVPKERPNGRPLRAGANAKSPRNRRNKST
jgi:hypothetical protein